MCIKIYEDIIDDDSDVMMVKIIRIWEEIQLLFQMQGISLTSYIHIICDPKWLDGKWKILPN